MSGAVAADYDEHAVTVAARKHEAAGMRAVLVSMQRGLEQMGALRTAAALARLNQRHGFDCPGCAWPEEHGGRKLAEFCENGAKAVAEEATKRVVTPAFFATHSIAELSAKPEYWLSQQGRLTHPMVLRPAADYYQPIGWDDAYQLIAEQLNGLDNPDEAVFYTSGRTSNEAAFCYQLLVRSFGTNNLPDCSNMCHESSGSALTESIGIGKGSVTVDDVEHADLIVIAGQNPGTNHPRMLSVLEKAKANGAKIIAINPLPEAGLIRFKDPQKVHGVVGHGVAIADEFVQIRLGGDMALFAGLGRLLLEADDRAPGTVIDREFVDAHCAGFDEYRRRTLEVDFDTVLAASGIERRQLERVAEMLMASQRTTVCWAMGLTQHTHAVATIGEVTNLLLLRGMIGKPGAGVCPVRGHSNVQGDRTMGIWEQMPEEFLAALDREFDITSPRKHGYDTVAAIRAMRDGRAKFFMAMGGNFASATPDTGVTEAALRNCALTVQISTKLNRSHLVHGATALILPTRAAPTEISVAVANRLSRSKIRCRWCMSHAVACARQVTRCAARWKSSASWPAGCLAQRIRCRGSGSRVTMTPSATRSPRWSPAATTTTVGCGSRTDFSFPTRPVTHANSSPAQAKPTSRSTRCNGCPCRLGGWCCRRCAAMTSTTPRSTGSMTVIAG